MIAKSDMQAMLDLAGLWMETFEIEGAKSI